MKKHTLSEGTPYQTDDSDTQNNFFLNGSSKKKKHSFYLSDAEEMIINEIYARNLMTGQKKDRSTIVGEALRALYEKENSF